MSQDVLVLLFLCPGCCSVACLATQCPTYATSKVEPAEKSEEERTVVRRSLREKVDQHLICLISSFLVLASSERSNSYLPHFHSELPNLSKLSQYKEEEKITEKIIGTAMESVFFEEAAAEELINKLLEEDRNSRKEEQKRQQEEEEEMKEAKQMEEDDDDEGEERLETMVDDHDKLDFEVEEEMAEKTG